MRIGTYNIWVSSINFEERLQLLCKIIKKSNADIIGLQEVKDENVVKYIQDYCDFSYSLWERYYDWDEGLALLSNYPILYDITNWKMKKDVHNSFVLRTVIEYNNIKIGVTNLHFDHKSALNREVEIADTIKLIEKYDESEYEILLGDFNDSPDSSIYRYLTGQQSLYNHATKWIDLAKSYAVSKQTNPNITLDFLNNPRWDNENVLEIPERFDWVMLKYPYPKKNPKLNNVKILGNERVENITPSDHYGVICDIDFNN